MGMPNYPAVYAIRAALEYIRSVGIAAIERHARPLVLSCLEEVRKLPVELLTPMEPEHISGIFSFRHPKVEQLNAHLHAKKIHVMNAAGRLRVAIHGYNTTADAECFVRELKQALSVV